MTNTLNAPQIIILGAGLTGLSIGYFLKKKGIPFLILEARNRAGGRVFTKYLHENNASLEMGATWFSKKHQFLTQLLDELGLGFFPQYTDGFGIFETSSFAPLQRFEMPSSNDPEASMRIRGGSGSLINALSTLLSEHILYGRTVESIVFEEKTVEIKAASGGNFKAGKVVSTLPPRLFTQTIRTEPQLPADVLAIAASTHTWMGESIKFSVEYEKPFWRERQFSGAAFSQSSISSEMHDHCGEDGRFFALKGFLNSSAATLSPTIRQDLVFKQLEKFYGKEALRFSDYHELVWSEERFTYSPYDGFVQAHQNNGHAVFRRWFLDGRLRLAGAETASVFPGYMDGAIGSAMEVLKELEETM